MDTHIVLTKHYHNTGQKKKGRDAIFGASRLTKLVGGGIGSYFLSLLSGELCFHSLNENFSPYHFRIHVLQFREPKLR